MDYKEKKINVVQKVSHINKYDNINTLYFNVYLDAFRADSKTKPYYSEFFDDIHYKGENYGNIDILSISIGERECFYNLNETILEVFLNENIHKGQEVDITIQFEASIPEIAHRVGYNDNAIWLTDFLPTIMSSKENNFYISTERENTIQSGNNFPKDISNYIVSVKTPKKYTVIGSGMEREDITDEEKITTIETSMVRDFSLVISDKFIVDEIELKPEIYAKIYHYSENDNYVDKMIKSIKKSFDFYEENIASYPYKQLKFIEIDYYMASEDSSSIVFIDSNRLNSENISTTISYIIGRQWFGNIVSSYEDDLWINNGILSFLQEYQYRNDTEIKEIMEKQLDILRSDISKMRDEELEDTKNYTNWNIYYINNYLKSKTLNYIIKENIGMNNYFDMVKKYYKYFSFKLVSEKEYFKFLRNNYNFYIDDYDKFLLEGETNEVINN